MKIMGEDFLTSLGLGISEVKSKYPRSCAVVKEGHFSHVVSFEEQEKQMKLQFSVDESFPSRVPKILVRSHNLSKPEKMDLEEVLKKTAKSHEYQNTLMLPLLIETALSWRKDGGIKHSTAGQKEARKKALSDTAPSDQKTKSVSVSFTCSVEPRSTPDISFLTDSEKQEPWQEHELWQEHEPWQEAGRKKPLSGTSLSDQKTESSPLTFGTVSFNSSDEPSLPATEWKTVMKSSRETYKRPNYFIAVRCTDLSIMQGLETVVNAVLKKAPVFKDICYNRNEIHVTICTLALHSSEEIQQAVNALNDMKSVLIANAPKQLLKIEGVSNFNDKVVYGQVHCPDDFLQFRKLLRHRLDEAQVKPRDSEDYTAHMTMIKVSQNFIRKTGVSTIPLEHYKTFRNKIFGKQKVEGIHLCQMGFERRADGFYVCPTHIAF